MKFDLTFILGIYGAALSTMLALLKILEYRKDRANIKITINSNLEVFPKNTVYDNMTLLSIRVINEGRRPITITHVSLMLPNSKDYLFCADPYSAKYPVDLTEGKYHDFNMNEDELKKKYELTPNQYVACVSDATGKTYWSHNFLLRLWKVGRIR